MEKGKEKNLEKMIENLGDQMVKGFTDADEKIIKLIEDLTSSTAAGFLGVHKKFDLIDVRFDKIDQCFDSIESRLGRVETEVAGLKTNMITLFSWVKKIDKDLEAANAKLDKLAGRIEKNEKENKALVIEVQRIDKELAKIKKILKIA